MPHTVVCVVCDVMEDSSDNDKLGHIVVKFEILSRCTKDSELSTLAENKITRRITLVVEHCQCNMTL